MPDVALPYSLTNGATADASQVMANLNAIVTALNDLDADNLSAALAQALGASSTGNARRGKSIIPGAETLIAAGYSYMPTPDRVQNLVVPTDGLIAVVFMADWKTASAQADAQIALDGSGVPTYKPDNTMVTNESGAASTTSAFYRPIVSTGAGLWTPSSAGATNDTTRTQPQKIATSNTGASPTTQGGLFLIDAAPGTHEVGIRFSSNSGTLAMSLRNRKLWAWTLGF